METLWCCCVDNRSGLVLVTDIRCSFGYWQPYQDVSDQDLTLTDANECLATQVQAQVLLQQEQCDSLTVVNPSADDIENLPSTSVTKQELVRRLNMSINEL